MADDCGRRISLILAVMAAEGETTRQPTFTILIAGTTCEGGVGMQKLRGSWAQIFERIKE